MRVAVTGSSGLIGTALVAALRADGHEVIRLVRSGPPAQDALVWDPRAERGGLDPASLDGVTAVVHLAGAGIADKRWTEGYQAEIRNSRIQGTRALVRALAAMAAPPGVLLSGSAIGWYGDTGGREVTESDPAGRGFLPELVRDWETAAGEAADAGTRVVTLRSGIVLSPGGGMLGRLLPLFRRGVGGRIGSGRQVMSWIGLSDWIAATRFLLGRADITGPVNMTTPNPVSNAEFTAALAAAVHRPAVMTVPVPALKLAVGGVSSDILSSARVLPRKLLDAGYQFQHPGIAGALAAELS
jgi:uncharacterized protein (TIGR01777 family)